MTLVAGFLLASKGHFDLFLFAATFLGLAFIMASGCVLNCYIDRDLDRKMERTKNRPLVTGAISSVNAILFAILLLLIGNAILWKYTNPLTVFIAAIGFVVYVFLYSLWKAKTIYGTAIGSISGAIPPLVGYCAVSNQFDLGALIFFLMMVLWQMPHFYAIAIYRIKDYTAAGIPVLPIIRGLHLTKVRMAAYVVAFIVISTLLTVFHYTGRIYLYTVIGLGLAWLGIAIQGFASKDDELWGRRMFQFSLIVIGAISLVIPLDLEV